MSAGLKDRSGGITKQHAEEIPASALRDFRLPALALSLTAIALYASSLGYGFIGWDDTRYVTSSPLISSMKGLGQIWFSAAAEQYYPLTFTTFWLEHRLWGDAALGYHATNVLLHALNTVVLLLLLRSLGLARWPACAVVLWFTVHPVQVMSVAWIAERKNLLSTLFCLLAYLVWLRFRRGRGERWYLAALGLFLAALLSKTAVLALPLALLALDRFQLRVSWRSSVARLLPFLLPIVLLGMATIEFEKGYVEGMPARADRPFISATALLHYTSKLLLPIHLAPFYPRWSVPLHSLWWWLPLLGVGALASALLVFRRRLPGLARFGLVHFTAFLAPVLGWIDYGNLALTYVADYYLYLPSIGLLLALVQPLDRLRRSGLLARRLLTLGIGLGALGLTVQTVRYMPTLANGESFWKRTLARDPDCLAAHAGLGQVYESRSEWGRAVEHYQRVARGLPAALQAQLDLGRALRMAGRYDEAEEVLLRYRRIDPGAAPALIELARIAEQTRRIDRARQLYDEALERDPGNAHAQVELGALYLGLLQRDRAADCFLKAIRLEPSFARAHLGLATALRGRRQFAEAADALRNGLKAAGADVSLLNLLARILATCPESAVRDGPQAVVLAERALALAGDGFPEILDTLAAAYAEAGRWDEAVETAARAAVAARDGRRAVLAESIAATLERYRRREPLRESPP